MNPLIRVVLPLAIVLAAPSIRAATAVPAAEPAAAPLPVEKFFERDSIESMQLSPSGRWLAVQAGKPGERVKLTVTDLEDKEPARVIAMFSRFDVRSFRWVNDDWLVFTLFDENDQSGKSSGGGLVSVRRDGEKMRLLIKRRYDSVFEEHGNTALEPNNEMVAIGAPGTNDIIVAENHFDTNYTEYDHTTLRRMDVATGAVHSLFIDDPAPPGKITDWLVDGRGMPRVAWAAKKGRVKIFWSDAQSRKWRVIGDFPELETAFTPVYVDDQDRLFVTATNPKTQLSELRKFDFTTGKPEKDAIIALPGFDANPRPIRDPGKNTIYGVRLLTDSESVAWFSPKMAAIQARVDAALPNAVNYLNCRPCDAPKVVLVFSYSDVDPGEYLLYHPLEDKFERLGAIRPGHQAGKMANVELFRTQTRDGADLPVWITKTASANAEPRPGIVYVHGGPWVRGGEWKWDPVKQFLATRGYVVIEPEYRGSTGYGYAHFRAGFKQWGQRMQDDVTDALRFAIDKGWVDSKRVCIVGASYGGYATLMGLARDQDKAQYKCGVAWVGVTDPRLMYSVYWSDISDAARQYSMPQMIGDLDKDAAMLKANAPIELASKIKAPLLLAYGGRDRRVPLVHGEKMRDALTEAGSPPEWIVYDNEGHGWQRTANNIDFWRRTEAFLAKYLK